MLFYNRQYELNEWRHDQQVEQRLDGRVRCQHFDDILLLPSGSVQSSSGEMYKVYTPFHNAFIRRLIESDVRCLLAPQPRASALPVPDAPPAFEYSHA